MSKFNVGDTVVAKLPNGTRSHYLTVTHTTAENLVGCVALKDGLPHFALLPADWLNLKVLKPRRSRALSVAVL